MVQQHIAGAVDLGRQIVRAAVIGVQFDHQPAMRLLDRFGVGAGREPEDGISLLDGHVAARRPSATARAAGALAGELVAPIGVEAHKNVTIDWTLRENVRAQLRVLVKRILRKYGYPPDKQEKATQTVVEQAALLSETWATAA